MRITMWIKGFELLIQLRRKASAAPSVVAVPPEQVKTVADIVGVL